MASSQSPNRPAGKCPICSRPTAAAYRPFCSRRCADVDLSRWLRGTYAIPDAGDSEDGDEGGAAEQDGTAGNGDKGS